MLIQLERRYFARWLLHIAALFVAAPAAAAPIAWSPSQDVAAATDIQLTGTVVEAINGTGSGVAAIVNGVTFLASDALLDESFSGDTLEGGSSGDAALDVLIGSFDYGSGTTPTISIGGGLLVAGDVYMIQVFFTDLRSCCNARNMTFGDGLGSDADLNATGAGLGQFVVGTFQADATSQSLSMATNGFGNAHIGGYQIRAVPEPGSGVLVLIGLTIQAARSRLRSRGNAS